VSGPPHPELRYLPARPLGSTLSSTKLTSATSPVLEFSHDHFGIRLIRGEAHYSRLPLPVPCHFNALLPSYFRILLPTHCGTLLHIYSGFRSDQLKSKTALKHGLLSWPPQHRRLSPKNHLLLELSPRIYPLLGTISSRELSHRNSPLLGALCAGSLTGHLAGTFYPE
jgi:hypothetical protein